MATSTVHPNHQLISSEDVEGTNVYDMKGDKIGEIDHLMIDKVSGRVTYAVMSFGGFIGLGQGRPEVQHPAQRIRDRDHRRSPEGRASFQRRFLVRPKLGSPYL